MLASYLLGVVLAIGAGIVNATGVTIQKLAHIANANRPDELKRSYIGDPWWLIGFGVYVAGNVANAFALALASQSIITPLNSVNLVANTMLAPACLGETLTRTDVIATLLIMIGCTITVLFGSHASETDSLTSLLKHAQRPMFLLYFGVMASTLTVAYLIGRALLPGLHASTASSSSSDASSASTRLLAAPAADDTTIAAAHSEPAVVIDAHSSASVSASDDGMFAEYFASFSKPARTRFLTLQFACLGGALSSVNILMTKCIAELVKETTSDGGVNEFAKPATYCFLLILLVSNVSEIYWMQRALQMFDALVVVPLFTVTVSMLSIVTGIIFFDELSTFTWTQFVLFPAGVLVTLSGVYLLSQREVEAVVRRRRLLLRRRPAVTRTGQLRSASTPGPAGASMGTAAMHGTGAGPADGAGTLAPDASSRAARVTAATPASVWRQSGKGYQLIVESPNADADADADAPRSMRSANYQRAALATPKVALDFGSDGAESSAPESADTRQQGDADVDSVSAEQAAAVAPKPILWKRLLRNGADEEQGEADEAWWEWEEVEDGETVDLALYETMEAEGEEVWVEEIDEEAHALADGAEAAAAADATAAGKDALELHGAANASSAVASVCLIDIESTTAVSATNASAVSSTASQSPAAFTIAEPAPAPVRRRRSSFRPVGSIDGSAQLVEALAALSSGTGNSTGTGTGTGMVATKGLAGASSRRPSMASISEDDAVGDLLTSPNGAVKRVIRRASIFSATPPTPSTPLTAAGAAVLSSSSSWPAVSPGFVSPLLATVMTSGGSIGGGASASAARDPSGGGGMNGDAAPSAASTSAPGLVRRFSMVSIPKVSPALRRGSTQLLSPAAAALLPTSPPPQLSHLPQLSGGSSWTGAAAASPSSPIVSLSSNATAVARRQRMLSPTSSSIQTSTPTKAAAAQSQLHAAPSLSVRFPPQYDAVEVDGGADDALSTSSGVGMGQGGGNGNSNGGDETVFGAMSWLGVAMQLFEAPPAVAGGSGSGSSAGRAHASGSVGASAARPAGGAASINAYGTFQ